MGHRNKRGCAVAGHPDEDHPEGLKALRPLALDQHTTVEAPMIEAENDLLRKYRRRPVAEMAARL
jgi:hypothetical protein